MTIPNGPFVLVALVTLIIPGFSYAVVRTAIRGFRGDDRALDSRLAQAVTFSVVLDSVYLVLVYPWIPSLVRIDDAQVAILHPIGLGLTVLCLGVLIPAALGVVLNLFRVERVLRAPEAGDENSTRAMSSFRIRRRPLVYRSTPNAWDWGVAPKGERLVRVRLPEGGFVGGWYGPGSYVSTYPEPRDIFLSVQYRLDAEGSFQDPVPGSAGLWLSITDKHILEFLDDPRDDHND